MSPEKLRTLLTTHSFEVEGLEKIGDALVGVAVGKILEISKHPNADKLQIVKLQTTNQKLKTIQVVCGAHNIAVGDKVPVATVGTKLPGGIEIKAAEIRGEKSFGMLCAKDELGLGEDHAGIFILGKAAKIGTSLAKHLNSDDSLLDIDVLPNRAHDCLSYVGMAREIIALEGGKFDYDYDGLKLPKIKSKKMKVEIVDKDLCLRYVGAVMENIEVKESPLWIQSRLLASDIRPINNIVDATNYVMLELGQPMHAFDATEVAEGKIAVRRAKKGEKIKMLDETEKILGAENLVIADAKKSLAVAGVMGGFNSGINTQTKTIILESANFNAVSIRRTRTSLGLKTDASDRFEKEIDPNLAEKAMVRAIEIIEHIAGGKLEGVVDIYPKAVKSWKIKLDLNYVNKLLGENIAAKRTIQILNSLEMKVSGKGNLLTVEIPTFRIDLKTQEDLIEEIGRIFGYENISAQPLVGSLVAPIINEERFFERKIKDVLTGLKFDEVYNYSFYGQKDIDSCEFGKMPHLELANPMSPEQQFMRVSLVPNLLKNVRDNLRNYKSFNIFESGRVYHVGKDILPDEKKVIMFAIVLENDPVKSFDGDHGAGKSAETFFTIKGVVSDLLKKIGVINFSFNTDGMFPPLWHPTRSAQIMVDGISERIGCMGEISPLVLANYKINKRVAMVRLDLAASMEASKNEKEFVQLRKYPTVTRDISMLSDKKVLVAEITEIIKRAGGNLVLEASLFDVFPKEDKNSFAFHVELGLSDRTLESAEIDVVMAKIISSLEKELKVEIRK